MRRGNIAGILISAAVVAVCAASPFFVSGLLDTISTERIQTDRTVARDDQRDLSLAEAIGIYSQGDNVVQEEKDPSDWSDAEYFAKEYPHIYDVVWSELEKLQEYGILPTSPTSDEEAEWACVMATFVDDQGNYVSVWDVVVSADTIMNIGIAEDQEKAIYISFDGGSAYTDANSDVGSLSRKWGEYLGLEKTGSIIAGEYRQYQDEEGTEVYYVIESGWDYLTITPADAREVEKRTS